MTLRSVKVQTQKPVFPCYSYACKITIDLTQRPWPAHSPCEETLLWIKVGWYWLRTHRLPERISAMAYFPRNVSGTGRSVSKCQTELKFIECQSNKPTLFMMMRDIGLCKKMIIYIRNVQGRRRCWKTCSRSAIRSKVIFHKKWRFLTISPVPGSAISQRINEKGPAFIASPFFYLSLLNLTFQFL